MKFKRLVRSIALATMFAAALAPNVAATSPWPAPEPGQPMVWCVNNAQQAADWIGGDAKDWDDQSLKASFEIIYSGPPLTASLPTYTFGTVDGTANERRTPYSVKAGGPLAEVTNLTIGCV